MSSSTSASASPTRLSKWSAVDLVTIALLAVAFRVLWYTGRAIPFPFSQFVDGFWMALTLAIAIRLVPKVGVSTLYYFAWSLFNTFFQGEGPLVILLLLPVGILPDVYLWFRRKRFDSSFTIVSAATFTVFLFSAILYVLYRYYFLMPVNTAIWAYILPLCVALALVGSVIGDRLGRAVKPLLR